MKRELDHLVVAARTLEEGAAWVEAALGVKTLPGGKHPLMGTHNRVLSIGRGRLHPERGLHPRRAFLERARGHHEVVELALHEAAALCMASPW